MGLYIVNKKNNESLISKVIKGLLLLIGVLVVVFGIVYYQKVQEANANKKIEKPLSNVSFEIEEIKELVGPENIKKLKLSKGSITFDIDEDINIEPLISRYEDMIEVIYNKSGMNIIKVSKLPIVEDKTKRYQLKEYMTKNKSIKKRKTEKNKSTKSKKEEKKVSKVTKKSNTKIDK